MLEVKVASDLLGFTNGPVELTLHYNSVEESKNELGVFNAEIKGDELVQDGKYPIGTVKEIGCQY